MYSYHTRFFLSWKCTFFLRNWKICSRAFSTSIIYRNKSREVSGLDMTIKIGVALGGGGARGLAHAGVLRVLEEEGIPIHCVAGVSIGAVVGAMFTQNPNVASMIDRFRRSLDDEFYDQLGLKYLKTDTARDGSFLHQATQTIKRRIVINLASSRKALLKETRLKNVLMRLVDKGNIEDGRIPLSIIATSLHTGEDVVFKKGDIITALLASTAIPGFLCPVCTEDDLLTDGAVSCGVPISYLEDMGADVKIGVEVSVRDQPPLADLNIIDIMNRADFIRSRKLAQLTVSMADIAISPDTKDIEWSEFTRADELIEAGAKSARAKIPEIRRVIQNKKPWYRRIFTAGRSSTTI
jgi:NTE family protein